MIEDKTSMDENEINLALARLDGWERDGVSIRKAFVFENFKEINRFLPYFTKTIVALNHHPDFAFEGGKKTVLVTTTTHSAGGLTRADFDLATALNAWKEMSS